MRRWWSALYADKYLIGYFLFRATSERSMTGIWMSCDEVQTHKKFYHSKKNFFSSLARFWKIFKVPENCKNSKSFLFPRSSPDNASDSCEHQNTTDSHSPIGFRMLRAAGWKKKQRKKFIQRYGNYCNSLRFNTFLKHVKSSVEFEGKCERGRSHYVN